VSNELILSGGDSLAVSTEEMLASAAELRRAADMSRDIADAIQRLDARLSLTQMESWGVPTGAARAEHDLECAYADLLSVAQRAETLSTLVRFAADSYGLGETAAENLTRRLIADAAGVVGFFFPAWVTTVAVTSPLLPLLAGIGAAAHLLGRTTPDSESGGIAAASVVSGPLNTLMSDPTFVLAVRHAVMSVDEFVAGASGVPPTVVTALSAAGLIGLSSSAGAVQQAGGIAGVLRETPVSQVSKTSLDGVEAPTTFAERLARIPRPDAGDQSQVRIEKYETPGEPARFEVYIAGTADFAIADSVQPWDMTSNISNTVGSESGSVAAVASAMRDAGITSENPVTFTGHSQGGATAARLAASGEFTTYALVAAGGNTGQIPIPEDVFTVLLEHSDDLVVAAGGLQDNSHALVVERQAFGGRALPEGVIIPAHRLDEYGQTARLMDQSESPELRAAAERLELLGGGETSTSAASYHYERAVPDSPKP